SIGVHGQSATEVAAAIDKVLQATRRGPGSGGAGGGGPGGGAVAAARRGAEAATLVPVDSARLVVMVGDEAAWRRVAALAERIDPPASDGGSQQMHVLYLAHTNADEMATTLKEVGLVGRG